MTATITRPEILHNGNINETLCAENVDKIVIYIQSEQDDEFFLGEYTDGKKAAEWLMEHALDLYVVGACARWYGVDVFASDEIACYRY